MACRHFKMRYNNIIVTGFVVTIGNCFPEVWEILPEADGVKSFKIVFQGGTSYSLVQTLAVGCII